MSIAKAAGWTLLVGLPVGLLVGLACYVGYLNNAMRPGGPPLRHQAEHVAAVADEHPEVDLATSDTVGSSGYTVRVQLDEEAPPEGVLATVHDTGVAVLAGNPSYDGTVVYTVGRRRGGVEPPTLRLSGRVAIADVDARAREWVRTR